VAAIKVLRDAMWQVLVEATRRRHARTRMAEVVRENVTAALPTRRMTWRLVNAVSRRLTLATAAIRVQS
jgi:hypothetical protein